MSFFRTFADADADLQMPAEVAVVMPTVLRPSLKAALQSIFEQSHQGRIQVLLGIDRLQGDLAMLEDCCDGRPSNVTVQVVYPGYSTSVRHGGLHPAKDGGALRCLMSYLANSRLVAYLDDDNWWDPDHLRLMIRAMRNAKWAYSYRWFVHPQSRRPVCVDDWESVGPDRGFFESQGGFVDPNCLMMDKLACEGALPWWNHPLPGDIKGMSADRHVFRSLRQNSSGACTGRPSVFYTLDPADALHPTRLQQMGRLYDQAAAEPPSGERIIPAVYGPYALTQRQI